MDNKKRENKLREKQIKAEKNKKILSKEELERREKIKKINDEFKIKNYEKSQIINEKEIWKYFFEKPKKNYNKYMCEMLDYPEYLMYDNEKVNEFRGKWNKFFKNENDIYLEIGCGSGNFTVQNAQKFPDRNYIALELRFKRLVLGAKKAAKRKFLSGSFLCIAIKQNGVYKSSDNFTFLSSCKDLVRASAVRIESLAAVPFSSGINSLSISAP